jgi:hypothetical protein
MQKPFSIHVKKLDGWYSAVCPELCVSGFGESKEKAVDSVVRAMRSTLAAQAASLQKSTKNYTRMAQVVPA